MSTTEVNTGQSDQRSFRILVVDDNHINQKVARLLLECVGHTVDIVVDGQEAVDAVNSHPYDLVLMDIHMPKMDGITATKLIREQGGNGATIPIIAVTAKAMVGDREIYIAAGMNDFVSKPINTAELHEAIARQCGVAVE